MDQLDFSKIVRLSGDTPPDIEQKCLHLCQTYLSGNWREQTVDTIEVRRITGGMINQLYYCCIKDPVMSEGCPQSVAIKLYGKNAFELIENTRNRVVIISLIFSKNKLGPKLYGVFEQGQIQQFYKVFNFYSICYIYKNYLDFTSIDSNGSSM